MSDEAFFISDQPLHTPIFWSLVAQLGSRVPWDQPNNLESAAGIQSFGAKSNPSVPTVPPSPTTKRLALLVFCDPTAERVLRWLLGSRWLMEQQRQNGPTNLMGAFNAHRVWIGSCSGRSIAG